MVKQNHINKKKQEIAIKLVFTLLMISYLVYVLFFREEGGKTHVDKIKYFFEVQQKTVQGVTFYVLLLLVLFLSFINWLLEAEKWRVLIKKLEPISIWKSYKSVLCGLSVGFFTPRSIGDYFGRMIHVSTTNRLKIVGALIISRLSQLFITILMGVFGYVVYRQYLDVQLSLFKTYEIVLVLLTLLAIVVFIVFRKFWVQLLMKIPQGQRVKNLYLAIRQYTNQEVGYVIFISTVRYLVFCSQLLLMLYIAGLQTPFFGIMAGVMLMLLVKSMFFTFNFLLEVGVRELAAVFFLGLFVKNEYQIIIPVLMIWVINILLPTFVGYILILKSKIRSSS